MQRLATELERDGFTQVGDVVSAGELDALRRAALALVDAAREHRGHDDPRYRFTQDRRSLRHILFPADLAEEFARLITHPGIVGVLAALYGPDLEFAQGKIVVKEPGAWATAPWHQDLPFSPHSNDRFCSIGLHLDDFSDGQGALRMIAGSHRAGLQPHRSGRLVDEDPARAAAITTLAVPRGAMTVHQGLTIHDAARNLAGELRLRVVYVYHAADSHPLRRDDTPSGINRHRELLVSGVRRPARDQGLEYQGDVYA